MSAAPLARVRCAEEPPFLACSRHPTTGRSNLVTRRFVNGTPDSRASRNVLFDNVTFYVPDGALNMDIKGSKASGIVIRSNGADVVCKPGMNKL